MSYWRPASFVSGWRVGVSKSTEHPVHRNLIAVDQDAISGQYPHYFGSHCCVDTNHVDSIVDWSGWTYQTPEFLGLNGVPGTDDKNPTRNRILLGNTSGTGSMGSYIEMPAAADLNGHHSWPTWGIVEEINVAPCLKADEGSTPRRNGLPYNSAGIDRRTDAPGNLLRLTYAGEDKQGQSLANF